MSAFCSHSRSICSAAPLFMLFIPLSPLNSLCFTSSIEPAPSSYPTYMYPPTSYGTYPISPLQPHRSLQDLIFCHFSTNNTTPRYPSTSSNPYEQPPKNSHGAQVGASLSFSKAKLIPVASTSTQSGLISVPISSSARPQVEQARSTTRTRPC